jgi:hypothetical protein
MAENAMSGNTEIFDKILSTITEERKHAGADYLHALQKLGMSPDDVRWVVHKETLEPHLAVTTSWVDRVGSKEIYSTLFDAYDHAGTPKSIDPWIVVLFSPHMMFNDWRKAADAQLRNRKAGPHGPNLFFRNNIYMLGDYYFVKEWVYKRLAKMPQRESRRDLHLWRRFQNNVAALAA